MITVMPEKWNNKVYNNTQVTNKTNNKCKIITHLVLLCNNNLNNKSNKILINSNTNSNNNLINPLNSNNLINLLKTNNSLIAKITNFKQDKVYINLTLNKTNLITLMQIIIIINIDYI